MNKTLEQRRPKTSPRCGSVIVISAPSGAGKSSVVKQLVASVPGLSFSVSHTTRPPRPGERNGREYFFVSPARFRRMVASKEFVEWADVHGKLYGTSWREVRSAVEVGKDILLDIDVQGHRQVRRRLPDAVSVFLVPPSFQELERRLRRRRSDTAEIIEGRLATARMEMGQWREYDYVVLNDRLSSAVQAVKAIVVAARLRRHHQQGLVEEIRSTFGG